MRRADAPRILAALRRHAMLDESVFSHFDCILWYMECCVQWPMLCMCRMRRGSSDTALDQLGASDAQTLQAQAGHPASPRTRPASGSSVLATPPRRHAPRASSEPPGPGPDQAAELAATRSTKSARFPLVHSRCALLRSARMWCRSHLDVASVVCRAVHLIQCLLGAPQT